MSIDSQAIQPPASEDVPPLFARLRTEIAEIDKNIDSAVSFFQVLNNNSDIFTESELVSVQNFYQGLQNRRELKVEELRQAIEVYETKVLKINNQLVQRRQILEKFDADTSLLSHHKDLMKAFASGQAALQKEMMAAQDQMNQ